MFELEFELQCVCVCGGSRTHFTDKETEARLSPARPEEALRAGWRAPAPLPHRDQALDDLPGDRERLVCQTTERDGPRRQAAGNCLLLLF